MSNVFNWLSVQKNYKLSLGLYKSLFAFLEVSLGIGAGVIAVDPPASFEELKSTWPAFVLAVAAAIFRFFSNRRKHAIPGYYSYKDRPYQGTCEQSSTLPNYKENK